MVNKIITLPDNQPYEPKFKPNWWNGDEYWEYHKRQGHLTSNCHWLNNIIHDLIDRGDIEVDGHTSNEESAMFKEPFAKHDKGKEKTTDNQDNYTKTPYDYDSTINDNSMDNHVYTSIIKDKTCEGPIQRSNVLLKGIGPSSSSSKGQPSKYNVTTYQGKVTLQGVPSKPIVSSSMKNEYKLVDHLGKRMPSFPSLRFYAYLPHIRPSLIRLWETLPYPLI